MSRKLHILPPVVAAVLLAGWEPASCGLERSRLEGCGAVEGSKLEASRLALVRPRLEVLSLELARGGLTTGEVEGAASGIPPSQLGALFFGVARELETLEGGTTETAIGYYMASLTDRRGPHYHDARRRIREAVLDRDLSAEEAAALYDGGRNTFEQLYKARLGISRRAAREALRDLAGIKADYHFRSRPIRAPSTHVADQR
jgi:hypothetical protein